MDEADRCLELYSALEKVLADEKWDGMTVPAIIGVLVLVQTGFIKSQTELHE